MSTIVRANQSIKKGDLVKVITGKEKGKSGKVLRILSSTQRVVVEHLHMLKKHQKPTANSRQGGIVEQEGSVHLSNVVRLSEAVVAPAKKKAPAKVSKKKEVAKS